MRSSFSTAQRIIAGRVALACAREQLVDADDRCSALVLLPALLAIELPLRRRGAFGLHPPEHARFDDPRLSDPIVLLQALAPYLPEWTSKNFADARRELADSVFNLALALLSRHLHTPVSHVLDPLIASEQAVVMGHPWHPMTKTRLGLKLRENLLHAPELCGRAQVTAVDIAPGWWARHELESHRCHDLIARLFGHAPKGWLRVPVLALQQRRLPRLLPDLWGSSIVPAPQHCHGHSLLSLRTVEVGEQPQHLKLAMDVLTTSARRVVSPMSAQNGPVISRLLAAIQACDPQTRTTLAIQPDVATAGLCPQQSEAASMLAVIIRPDPRDISGTLPRADGPPPSLWVCAALGEVHPQFGTTFLERLVDQSSGADTRARAHNFLRAYVHALVPPLLRFCCTYGLALEAHLQNMMVAHRNGDVLGFVIRDLGGIRISRARLQAAGYTVELAPGSFLEAADDREFLGKLIHTLLHAHLGSVIGWACDLCAADPGFAWSLVRDCIDAQLTEWSRELLSAHSDRRAFLEPTHRAKALFAMRLLGRSVDYHYTTVDNPLAQAPALRTSA